MDGAGEPCQIKHGEGWRPGGGRYREEGPRPINAQSQKKKHKRVQNAQFSASKLPCGDQILPNYQVVGGARPPSFHVHKKVP